MFCWCWSMFYFQLYTLKSHQLSHIWMNHFLFLTHLLMSCRQNLFSALTLNPASVSHRCCGFFTFWIWTYGIRSLKPDTLPLGRWAGLLFGQRPSCGSWWQKNKKLKKAVLLGHKLSNLVHYYSNDKKYSKSEYISVKYDENKQRCSF